MKPARLFRIAGALLITVAAASCAQTVDISSPTGLANGVNSKGWNLPAFADAGLYLPGQLRYQRAVRSFDAVPSGNTVQIAASLYDTATTRYLAYARQYTDPLAWAPLGNGFNSTGSFASGNNTGEVSIALGPGGLLLQTIFDGSGVGSVITAMDNAGAWTSVSSSSTTLTSVDSLTIAGADLVGSQPDAATAFDPLGRAYAFWIKSGGVLTLGNWQPGNQVPGVGLSFAAGTIAGGFPAAGPIEALWDGTRFVCATYEVGNTTLKSSCIDTSQTPVDASAAKTATIDSASLLNQHATATDGAGGFMTVYFKQVAGSMNVFASQGAFTTAGPVWSSSIQIDAGLSPLVAPDQATTATKGAAPGVAYLGNGNYIAVWEEIGAAAHWTAIYSAVYLAGSGWSAPAMLPNTGDYFNTIPHPRSLHVFGNGASNAGFALNTIYNPTCGSPLSHKGPDGTNQTSSYPCLYDETQYFSTAWCYPASSVAPLCTVPTPVSGNWAPLHVLWVNRFQIDVGWGPTWSPNNQFGTKCQAVNDSNPSAPSNTAPGGGAIPGSSCTLRPKGALLPSGDTLVLFEAQDNDGNFRLGGVEFR